jgi:hypothetical protein
VRGREAWASTAEVWGLGAGAWGGGSRHRSETVEPASRSVVLFDHYFDKGLEEEERSLIEDLQRHTLGATPRCFDCWWALFGNREEEQANKLRLSLLYIASVLAIFASYILGLGLLYLLAIVVSLLAIFASYILRLGL